MPSFNPRVWLRDWLNKPTQKEHAESHAYGHWINAYRRYIASGQQLPPNVLPEPKEAARQGVKQNSVSSNSFHKDARDDLDAVLNLEDVRRNYHRRIG